METNQLLLNMPTESGDNLNTPNVVAKDLTIMERNQEEVQLASTPQMSDLRCHQSLASTPLNQINHVVHQPALLRLWT